MAAPKKKSIKTSRTTLENVLRTIPRNYSKSSNATYLERREEKSEVDRYLLDITSTDLCSTSKIIIGLNSDKLP